MLLIAVICLFICMQQLLYYLQTVNKKKKRFASHKLLFLLFAFHFTYSSDCWNLFYFFYCDVQSNCLFWILNNIIKIILKFKKFTIAQYTIKHPALLYSHVSFDRNNDVVYIWIWKHSEISWLRLAESVWL